jgi:hypothetical protein
MTGTHIADAGLAFQGVSIEFGNNHARPHGEQVVSQAARPVGKGVDLGDNLMADTGVDEPREKVG